MSQIGDRPNDKKKVVKVVSLGLSPIGEKYPQTKEKPSILLGFIAQNKKRNKGKEQHWNTINA